VAINLQQATCPPDLSFYLPHANAALKIEVPEQSGKELHVEIIV
jgi:hypothetical protein